MTLCIPATNTALSVVDLLPQLKETCLIVKGLFTPEECQNLKKQAIKHGFASAHHKYPTSYRNNSRIEKDDPLLANILYKKCQTFLPKKLKIIDQEYTPNGLNPRLRYCRYSRGEQFSIHRDGVFYQDDNHQSKLTFLLYLNCTSEFKGGATTFYQDQYGEKLLASYTPEVGDVAIFDHGIWHSGNKVTQGSKYILRSDFIYKQCINKNSIENTSSQHKGYIWNTLAVDKNVFASASRDKSIKLWDRQLKCLQTLRQHKNSIFNLAVDVNKNLYAISRDGYMTKWKKKNSQYQLDWKINTLHPSVLDVIALDNKNILTSGSDGIIRMWQEQKQVSSFKYHRQWCWSLVDRDGKSFISCDAGGVVNIINISTGELISSQQLSYALRCMKIYKDDIFIGDEKGRVHQLSTKDLVIKNTQQLHKGIVRDIVTNDNGVISCGEDNKVLLSDIKLNNVRELYTHDDFATSLTLINKDELISSSYSGTIVKICL